MRVAVVYESVFGDTEVVAGAVASGLREGCRHRLHVEPDVRLASVEEPALEVCAGIHLLVAGGPTHFGRLSWRVTRLAAGHGHPATRGGMRGWLRHVPPGDHRPAVCFDTRLDQATWLTGSAATAIGRRLTRLGWDVRTTESFFVTGLDGPLAIGEKERARRWGATLCRQLPSPPP